MENTKTSRRQFLAGAAALVAAGAVLPARAQDAAAPKPADADKPNDNTFKLAPLPYPYEALEPHIDVQTMRIHHDKHHAAYVNNLNAALKDHADLKGKSLEDLLRNLDAVPESIRTAVRNNGGGHANHSMFWDIITPGGSKTPTGELAEAINSSFESFDKFQKAFEEAGAKRFGSGWVWLIKPKDQMKLEVVSTPNQDTPLMEGHHPIIGNDVWEHAYYLKYQNRRADYLKAWWNVLNWDKAAERFAAIKG